VASIESPKVTMSQRPSFAVVIPTYNRARRLLRTLETVFCQEHPASEIIVVDDCSTDETPVVLERLATEHPELRVVRHDQNRERSASRNTGMELATAEYVTFLDSDDWMYPWNLRDANDFVLATGSQFFHNLYHTVDESGRHVRNWPRPSVRNRLRSLSFGNFLSCLGVFIHREIYTAYRFDTNLSSSEDYEFWLRVAADFPLGRIRRVNSAIVHHSGRSVLKQDLGEAEERMDYLADKVFSDPHLAEVYGPFRARFIAGRMVFLAGIANENREVGLAFDYLWRALKIYPVVVGYPKFLRSFQLACWNRVRGAGRASVPMNPQG
jgi:glycosyltransferase involved in cell wall biosynthesis